MLIWLWSNNFESTNSYFLRTVLFVITLSHIRGWHNFCSGSVYKYILSIISWVFGIINLGDSASLWKCQSHIQILSTLTFHTYRYSSFLNKLDFVTKFFLSWCVNMYAINYSWSKTRGLSSNRAPKHDYWYWINNVKLTITTTVYLIYD